MTIFLLPCFPQPVINDLVLLVFCWPVLRCPSLAGFQVSPEVDSDRVFPFALTTPSSRRLELALAAARNGIGVVSE
jgi:hypothetical protein